MNPLMIVDKLFIKARLCTVIAKLSLLVDDNPDELTGLLNRIEKRLDYYIKERKDGETQAHATENVS